MLEVVPHKSFKRDLKKFQHQKEVIVELNVIIRTLSSLTPLPAKYRDHRLIGEGAFSKKIIAVAI